MSSDVQGNEPSPDPVPRTDRGLTEAGDAGHRAYVQAKLVEAAADISKIRSPLSWQRQVELWGDSRLLHDMMMYGHQRLQGRSPEQGWRLEHSQPTSLGGPRRHDAALITTLFGRPVVSVTTEYKAGGIGRDEGLRQLAKERELLRQGLILDRSEYIFRGARPPSPEVVKEARQLAKDFPGKFVVYEMSEQEFERCVEAGRPIAQAKAVERLGHLVEKVRDSPELATAPQALERFIAEIEQAKQRGRPISVEVLVGARMDLADLVDVDKETTQRIDRIAREAAQLRLKEAQIVEQVQAQQREDRYGRLSEMVAQVDREIVLAAATAAREQASAAPAKALVVEVPEGADPMVAAVKQSAGMMAQLVTQKKQAAVEKEVLAGLELPEMYEHVAAKVLDLTRDSRGPVSPEQVLKAEKQVRDQYERARVEAEQERARKERETVKAQAKEQALTRLVDAHNARLEKAAQTRAVEMAEADPVRAAAHAKSSAGLAKHLRFDRDKLADMQVDVRAVEAIARGDAVWDPQSRSYVVEVAQGETLHVGRKSWEVHYARQVSMVEKGADLQQVQFQEMTGMSAARHDAADSREELERVREEAALARERAIELDQSISRTARREGLGGPELGLERDR